MNFQCTLHTVACNTHSSKNNTHTHTNMVRSRFSTSFGRLFFFSHLIRHSFYLIISFVSFRRFLFTATFYIHRQISHEYAMNARQT